MALPFLPEAEIVPIFERLQCQAKLNACQISWNMSAAPGCTVMRHSRRHVGAFTFAQ